MTIADWIARLEEIREDMAAYERGRSISDYSLSSDIIDLENIVGDLDWLKRQADCPKALKFEKLDRGD